MIPRVIARVSMVVAALAISGWLAVLARDVRLQDRGAEQGLRAVNDRSLVPGSLALLDDAKLLSVDRAPDMWKARVLAATGSPRAAVAVAEDVLRSEPEYLALWSVIAGAAPRFDPGLARLAAARAKALNPRQ